MKKLLVVLIIMLIGLGCVNAQMVNVNRWISPVVGDFTSIPENKGTDAQITSWGYTGKIFQYQAYTSRPAGSSSTAVYRWEMGSCKEFILIAEHELTDQQLISWGYKNKELLFYAYRTRPTTGSFEAVSRWVNTLPQGNNCRDFTLSVAEHELTDAQLTSWGYTNKMVQFYVPAPNNSQSNNPTLTISQQGLQTEGQLTIRISGAAPNSDVTVTVSNVPLTANQSCRIRTNNEGVGSCILRYPYRTSWCSLTPAYRLGRGIVRATNSNGQIIANTDFGIDNLYSRPVGGNCPNNLTVNVKTGGDDLRGGSSRAFIKFHFRNSGTTTEFPLSSGAAWAGNSWQTRDFAVGTHNPDDLVGVTIRHDGTPNNDPFNGGDVGHTYDNWNIDKIVVKYNGGVELINLGGTPLVRFTGALREQRWNR